MACRNIHMLQYRRPMIHINANHKAPCIYSYGSLDSTPLLFPPSLAHDYNLAMSKPNGAPLVYDINIPYTPATPEERAISESKTKYPKYLPTWEKVWFDT